MKIRMLYQVGHEILFHCFGKYPLTLGLFLLLILQGFGQISFTGNYSQDFNSMSGTTLPTGWVTVNRTATTGDVDFSVSSLASNSTGASYKFVSSSDYTIGLLNSGTFGSGKTIKLTFTNNTGRTITQLALAFDYRKFRSGSRAWSWAVTGSSGSVSSSLNISYSADANNNVTYFPGLTSSVSGNITGLSITNGSTYTITWTLSAGGDSNGQALGIDNFTMTTLNQASFAGINVPQYMSSGDLTRLPVMYRASVSGLSANTTYRYYTQGAISSDFGSVNPGAGNPLLISTSGSSFTYTSGPSLTSAGNYETFTTDASGNYTGWFGLVNTSNSRFTPGNLIYPTIAIANTSGALLSVRALDQTITVLGYSTNAGVNNGSFFKEASSGAVPKNFTVLYDNISGTGRPIYIAPIENKNAVVSNVIGGYTTISGGWNAIIPNSNSNGVRRIEQRDYSYNLVSCVALDSDGNWPNGPVNTVNPTNGTSPIIISSTDAPFQNGTWLGSINSDWSNSANWCVQPTQSTDNAVIKYTVSSMPVVSTSGIYINNLTIDNFAQLTFQGSNTITLGGDFINNGILSPGSGAVNFYGTAIQVISGSGVNLFNDIKIQNTTGVVLGNTISISGTLSLGSNSKYSSGGNTTVLLSGVTNTARIASLPSGATITGNVSMQRYIPAKPTLRLISSAVSGATVSDWKSCIPISGIGGTGNGFDASTANINTVWYFNESINAPTTYKYVGAPSATMPLSVGAGYRVYVRGNRTIDLMGAISPTTAILSVTNSVNQGNISLPVTYSNYNTPFRDGTNLVGNPYPCEINWDAVGWTKVNIDNALYMFDPNLGTNGQYFSYVDGISVPARTNPGIIASSQGFFVKANAPSPVLALTEAVKTIAGHSANFKIGDQDQDQILRIKLLDSLNYFDETVVRLKRGSSLDFEKNYDAYKFYNSTLNISSNPIAGLDLSINTLDITDSMFELPLSIYSNKSGTYFLQATGWENMINDFTIYLKDSYLGVQLGVNSAINYKFDITSDPKSFGGSRFSLLVERKQLVTSANSSLIRQEPRMIIHPNPNKGMALSIDLYHVQENYGEIKILDISAHEMFSKNLSIDSQEFTKATVAEFEQLPNGVYFIQFSTSNRRLVEKVILMK